MQETRIVVLGDVFGDTGRKTLAKSMPEIIEKYQPDWIIANGENISGGNGISKKHANFLLQIGVDVITTGNHLFARNDWQEVTASVKNILRPHNMLPDNFPSKGIKRFSKEGKQDIQVMNLCGRVFMEPCFCPFQTFDRLFAELDSSVPLIVDFHAEATSEKQAFGWHAAGRASAVYGTHTHVQTSDARIITSNGRNTAFITDIGMTGSRDGIIGVDRDTIIDRFLSGYSDRFTAGDLPGKAEGAFFLIDGSGAVQIESFRFFAF